MDGSLVFFPFNLTRYQNAHPSNEVASEDLLGKSNDTSQLKEKIQSTNVKMYFIDLWLFQVFSDACPPCQLPTGQKKKNHTHPKQTPSIDCLCLRTIPNAWVVQHGRIPESWGSHDLLTHEFTTSYQGFQMDQVPTAACKRKHS